MTKKNCSHRTLCTISSNKFLKSKFMLYLVLAMLCFSSTVNASGLQISPVKIFFKQDQKMAAFTIKNLKPNKIILQSEIKQWRQKDGENIFKDQQDLIVAPTIISIQPGESQIFRIALKKPLIEKKELSYRIFLHEVISQQQRKAGLNFVLQISLPIFISPIKEKPGEIIWQEKHTDKDIILQGKNTSNQHILISHIKIKSPNTKDFLVNENVFTYLLPYQSHTWYFNKDLKSKSFIDNFHESIVEAVTQAGLVTKKMKF